MQLLPQRPVQLLPQRPVQLLPQRPRFPTIDVAGHGGENARQLGVCKISSWRGSTALGIRYVSPELPPSSGCRARRAAKVFRGEGIALRGRPGCRGLPGLPAGLAWRVHLGRRCLRNKTGTTLVARPVANLVRHPCHGYAAILPPAAQRLLARAQAVGRCHARLSSGQYLPARHGGPLGGVDPSPPGGPRRVPGGGDLRLASGAGGIGGLDHGTEEHAFGRVLLGGHAELSPLRPHAEASRGTLALGIVPAGPAEQDGHGNAAGGAAGDLLVAAGPVVVENGRVAAGCPFSCWARPGA